MTNNEIIHELQMLMVNREEMMKQVERKRWLPSEKAMSLAMYRRQIDALGYTIGTLRAVIKQTENASFIDGVLP